jgi:hypothetical protein
MSYCSGSWFSDYNYRLMQVYLTPADRTLGAEADRAQAAAAAAEPQPLLVISGDVDAQGLHLNPIKATTGTPRGPDAGPYLLRITTQAGAVIEQRFAAREVDHDHERQRFGFTLAHPGPIERVDVLHADRVVHQRQARSRAQAAGTAAAPAHVQATELGGVLALQWDAARHPHLTVMHVGAARTAIAIDLQGGQAQLHTAALPAAGRFEFVLSDGLNTERFTLNR